MHTQTVRTHSQQPPPGAPREPLARVTPRSPCPVCRKPDWCLVSRDGLRAICMRDSRGSKKPARGGGWLHVLGDAPAARRPAPPVKAVEVERAEPAPVEHRDGVYCAMLRRLLSLSDAHRELVRARGFTDEEVAQRGYVSTPSAARGDEIADELSAYGLEGVAGFYRERGRWRMARVPAGFFVPYRDERGRVAGLQFRCDESASGKYRWLSSGSKPGGVSSGSPVHFAGRKHLAGASEILITEGALKADLIAHFLGAPVVAAAGVYNFGADFPARLRAWLPNVSRVLLAFDMDWQRNGAVLAALSKLRRELGRAGYTVAVRTWPAEHKGLDDYLLHLSKMEGGRV